MKIKKKDLTRDLVLKFVIYEKERGLLYWKDRGDLSSKKAFATDNGAGYKQGSFFGLRIKAHTIVWLIETGELPKESIDHINGDGSDNKFENLRDVAQSINCKNNRKRTDNTSGYVGVSFHKKTRKWRAHVGFEYVGLFNTIEEAAAARSIAQKGLGYTERHGS